MPIVVLIAGPNGAGKSTAAPYILRDLMGIEAFVNADDIARGLSAFNPESVAQAAGRLMLERLRELADQGEDFAFETTLASRSFAPWLAGLREQRYRVMLNFLWVPDPALSISRIEGRVRQGGHFVPDDIVRRRYGRSLRNLFELYQPVADRWVLYDNSLGERRRIARGSLGSLGIVYNAALWRILLDTAQSEVKR